MASCEEIDISKVSNSPIQPGLQGIQRLFTSMRNEINEFPFEPSFGIENFLSIMNDPKFLKSFRGNVLDMIYSKVELNKTDEINSNLDLMIALRIPVYLASGFIEKSNSIDLKQRIKVISQTDKKTGSIISCLLQQLANKDVLTKGFPKKSYKVRPFSVSVHFDKKGAYNGLVIRVGSMTKKAKLNSIFSKNKEKDPKAILDEIQSVFKKSKNFFIPYSFLEEIDKLKGFSYSNQSYDTVLNNVNNDFKYGGSATTVPMNSPTPFEEQCDNTPIKAERIYCKCKNPGNVIKLETKNSKTYYSSPGECIEGEFEKRNNEYTKCLSSIRFPKATAKERCLFERIYEKPKSSCAPLVGSPGYCVKQKFMNNRTMHNVPNKKSYFILEKQDRNGVSKPDNSYREALIKLQSAAQNESRKSRNEISKLQKEIEELKKGQPITPEIQKTELSTNQKTVSEPSTAPNAAPTAAQSAEFVIDPARKLICNRSVRLPLITLNELKNNMIETMSIASSSVKANIFRKVYIHNKFYNILNITNNPNENSFETLLSVIHKRVKEGLNKSVAETTVISLNNKLKGLEQRNLTTTERYDSPIRLGFYVLLQIGVLTGFGILVGMSGGALIPFSGVIGTAWIGFSKEIKEKMGVSQERERSMFDTIRRV